MADKGELLRKQLAYLSEMKQAYAAVFDNPMGEKVLKDLSRFCYSRKTTFTPDERLTVMLEGRREVWLRIEENLQLTPDELWNLREKGSRDG